MKKIFIISVVAIVLFLIVHNKSNAQLTPNGTPIQNTATATAQNITSATQSTVTTNVKRIVGACYLSIPADTSANPGDVVDLIFTISNAGNAIDTFHLYTNQSQSGGSTGGNWTIQWLPSSNITVGSNNISTFTMRVTVSALAQGGSYIEYRVEAASLNTNDAIKKGRYKGDNDIWYGGDMGISWDGSTTNDDGILRTSIANYGATSNSWIRITVTCPSVNITGFKPSKGYINDSVTISGSGFGSTTGVVRFNGVNATVTSWADNQIIVTVPNGATTGPISVTNACGNGDTTSSNFIVLTSIYVQKEITNVQLGGADNTAIPGASITYRIKCSNQSSAAASNIILYDKIDVNYVTYKTNSDNTPPGWTIEWSTNTNPDQSFNSADYTTTSPPVSQIRWVRWKKSSMSGNTKDIFKYSVIIK